MSDVIARIHRCVAVGELDKSILAELHACGTAVHECEVLDFKQQLPDSDFEYAKTVRDLVALHNSFGGFLVFGVREMERDRSFELIGVEENKLHIAKLRDLARSYLGKDVRIKPFGMQVGEVHLDGLWVAKRSLGENPLRFNRSGPEEKPGKPCFRKNEIVFRRLESNGVAQVPEDFDFLFSPQRPPSLELSTEDVVNEAPLDHNLPDRAFIPEELIDQFVTGPMSGEAVNAASMAFKKALIERVMGAELGQHLGYSAGAAKPEPAANQRNGRSAKTVLTGEGPVRIEVPRDRDGIGYIPPAEAEANYYRQLASQTTTVEV